MKFTTLALTLTSFLTFPAAHAASVTLQNFGATELQDNAGNPLANGGFIALYTFGPGDGTPPTSQFAAVLNGSNGLLNNTQLDASLNGGQEGRFFVSFGFANDGSIIGQNIYFMFGNGPNAENSTAIGLVNLNLSPNISDSPPPGWVVGPGDPGSTFAPSSEDVVFGCLSHGALMIGGFQEFCVPEPGVGMLLVLAAFGSVLRRQRRVPA